jgi:hypothetical protein
MSKSTAMILRGVVFSALFSFVSQCADAQFISMNEPRRKEFKNTEKNSFSVAFIQDQKNPFSCKVIINNPVSDDVKVYLRNRNQFNYIDQIIGKNDSRIAINLDLSLLEDGEYTFVVKTDNNFFIKHISLDTLDLSSTKSGRKETMVLNRFLEIGD